MSERQQVKLLEKQQKEEEERAAAGNAVFWLRAGFAREKFVLLAHGDNRE